MSKIVDRTGKGAAIDPSENDSNLDALAGIVSSVTGTTDTVDVDDQNGTVEYNNATGVTVTLDDISTIDGLIHTTSFKVTLKTIGAGAVTVNRSGTDVFDDGSTSLTLNRYDARTLQFDAGETKWNIVSEYIEDAATKTGTETLTNKTLTSPTINSPQIDGINDTNGVTALGIAATVGATSYIAAVNSAGDTPSIQAHGTGSNLNLELYAKGTGSVVVQSPLYATYELTAAAGLIGDVTGDVTGNVSGATVAASSTITKASIPVYGLVVLDTPELLTSVTTEDSWISSSTFASTTLPTAGAVKAILRIYISQLNVGTTSVSSVSAYVRKTGSGVAKGVKSIVATSYNTNTQAGVDLEGAKAAAECIVNLDGSSDFDYYLESSTVVDTFTIHLVGYYV